MNDRLSRIQQALQEQGLDGWLFFDHHFRDPIAYRVLGLDRGHTPTRRWYYLLPAQGEPVGLVHAIESKMLDALPGEKRIYSNWATQQDAVRDLIAGKSCIAMQYSPLCAIPYVANVDAGTIELVRQFVPDIRSSADLVQYFEARWTGEQLDSHLEAGRRVDAIRRAAFQLVSEKTRAGQEIREYDVARFILESFEREGLETGHGPIVAVNEHCSDPHYEPDANHNAPIKRGDAVLIDLWAKMKRPDAVYYDITWTGFCGENAPEKLQEIFKVVTGARDAAIDFVKEAVLERHPIKGYQVDDAAREHVRSHGYDKYFVHRTGHSIGSEDVHGNGANMDNWETHDIRAVIPHTCFSVEPGVYLPEFGIRSEVNVFVGDREARVTGEIQRELLVL